MDLNEERYLFPTGDGRIGRRVTKIGFESVGREREMDQATMEFWQNHSLPFLEMAVRTDRRQVVQNADGYAKLSRECGDTMEIFLVIRNGRIHSAAFETDGCLFAVVCANAAVNLVEGKNLQEAQQLAPGDIVSYLETLPPEETHCAEQAVHVLRLAIADARDNERQPWKKFYPRR
jgi:nitrogen fixation protein NifU and related proteins